MKFLSELPVLFSHQWYDTEGVSKGKLFAITNVKTALAALIEISYEGEGGVACNPFIENNKLETYDINMMSKSHFIKFQEMAHERNLVVASEKPPPWTDVTCLDHSNKNCGCVLPNGTLFYSSNETCLRFCFTGQPLNIDDHFEVWPIKPFPYFPNTSVDITLIPQETKDQADHFDQTYTTLLHCLGKLTQPISITECSHYK